MKKLLAILLVLAAFVAMALPIFGQTIQSTPATPHTLGTPTHTPSTYGSHLAFDKTNGILYQRLSGAWVRAKAVPTDGDKGDITVSSTGTNWQLDASSVENTEIASGAGGIYKGSGTVPASTTATAASGLTITNSGTGVLTFGNPSSNRVEIGPTYGYLGGTQYSFTASSDDSRASVDGPKGSIEANNTGLSLQIGATATIGAIGDNRASPKGMEYSGDYSATYTDRSLVDKAYVVSQNGTNANLTGPVTSVGNATTITANSIDSTHISNGTISPNDLAQRGASVGQVMTYTANGWRAATAGGGGASYLVYTALLSQSGTDAPTATVLENTLGGTVVWTWEDVGFFRGTLTSAFPSAKTWATASIDLVAAADEFFARIARESDNLVKVQIFDAAVAAINGCNNMAIEIRVYP